MTVIVAPRRTLVPSKVPSTTDLADGEMGVNLTDGKIYQRSGSTVYQVGSKAEGTVTSVGISTPLGFSVTTPVVTTSGSVGFTWTNLPSTPNTFLRANGLSAPPSWTTLDASDIPDLPASKITSGTIAPARLPYSLDFIHGLNIYTTGTTILISAGSAYVYQAAEPVSYIGGSITSATSANTTYHLYLDNTGSVVRSTTAPGTPYYLHARRRGAFIGTRYLGTVFTDSSGNYLPQKSSGMDNTVIVDYLYNIKAASSSGGGTVLANGTATSPTDIDLTSRVPFTATDIVGLANHVGSGGLARFYGWDGSSGFTIHSNVNTPGSQNAIKLAVDFTPKVQYDVTTGGVAWLWLSGYTYVR